MASVERVEVTKLLEVRYAIDLSAREAGRLLSALEDYAKLRFLYDEGFLRAPLKAAGVEPVKNWWEKN